MDIGHRGIGCRGHESLRCHCAPGRRGLGPVARRKFLGILPEEEWTSGPVHVGPFRGELLSVLKTRQMNEGAAHEPQGTEQCSKREQGFPALVTCQEHDCWTVGLARLERESYWSCGRVRARG